MKREKIKQGNGKNGEKWVKLEENKMDNCNTHKIFKGIYREEAIKKKIRPNERKKKAKI